MQNGMWMRIESGGEVSGKEEETEDNTRYIWCFNLHSNDYRYYKCSK